MTVAEQPQHMQALALANERRLKRSATCRALRLQEIAFVDIDLEAPEFDSMPVFKLLQSLPWSTTVSSKVARRTAKRGPTKVLNAARIPATFTVGRLTERQRETLRLAVSELCPSQKEMSDGNDG